MARRFELLHSLKDVQRLTKQMDSVITDEAVKREMFAIGTPVAILGDEYKQIPFDGYPVVYWVISDINRDMQVYGSGVANDVLESNGLTAFFGQTRVIVDFFENSGVAYAAGQSLYAKKVGNATVLTNKDPNEGASNPNPSVKPIALVEDVVEEGGSVIALKIKTL
ncbi:MAG: hypothetical protein PWQ59_1902 [Thermoanaerobacterium sp.]|nr:hypothetical protein [Thermoanaerobacterium sp.]